MDHSQFESLPKPRTHRLNVLPSNPETASAEELVGLGRFPSWLHRKMPKGNALMQTGDILAENRLHTVCEEAKCPNLLECWSKKTATFLVMGKQCTRSCGFCDIDYAAQPAPLEADEPERVANSVRALGLRHVVLTMVARDDLSDGGSAHLAAVIQAIRRDNEAVTIEVLTSDFAGNESAWQTIIEAAPEIFNHNLETVQRLTPRVRHKATYARTLQCLQYASSRRPKGMLVKSGLMVGLGETEEEVEAALRDLHAAGCDIVTIGQYLQANARKLRVQSFVPPLQFEAYAAYGRHLGIPYLYCGPFVRSSYNAAEVLQKMQHLSI